MQMLNRKIQCIFFLGILLLPAVLSLYLYASQIFLQHKMKEELKRCSLVTVAVPASHLHWNLAGKEVRIDGNLFDVKSYELIGNQVILTGLFDEEEDLLIEHILDIQQNNDPDKTNGSLTVFKWLSCFSLYLETDDLNTSLFTIKQQYPLSDTINLFCTKMLIDTPPPKQNTFVTV